MERTSMEGNTPFSNPRLKSLLTRSSRKPPTTIPTPIPTPLLRKATPTRPTTPRPLTHGQTSSLAAPQSKLLTAGSLTRPLNTTSLRHLTSRTNSSPTSRSTLPIPIDCHLSTMRGVTGQLPTYPTQATPTPFYRDLNTTSFRRLT